MREVIRVVPPPVGRACWLPAGEWSEAWWGAWLTGKGWSDAEILSYLHQRRAWSVSVTKGKGKASETTRVYAPTPMGALFHGCLLYTSPSPRD